MLRPRCAALATFGSVLGVFLLTSPAMATPVSALPDLSLLAPYALFGNGVNLNLATVNGDVGVSNNGTITESGPSTINGDVFLGTGVAEHISGTVNGTITRNLNLTAEKAQVLSASQTLLGLTPDYTPGAVSNTQTFAAGGPVTVINLTSFSGSGNIVLSGTPDDVFVINVTGAASITGSGGVSGVDASHVLFNLAQNLNATTGMCTASTNMGTITHINNVLNATTLLPCNTGTFHSANGAIFGDYTGTITLMSGATLNQVPFSPPPTEQPEPIPEPNSIMLLACGLLTTLVGRRRL